MDQVAYLVCDGCNLGVMGFAMNQASKGCHQDNQATAYES
jgi:hypothetical protein